MRVLRPAFLLLLLVALSFAYPSGDIVLTPFEHMDMGNTSQPKFDGLVLKMDCNAGTLKIYALSGNSPVEGATSLLKSTNYEQPLIGSGTTDSNGYVAQHIPGNLSFFTGFFVLTVEKPGYEEREVHFDINGCFGKPSGPTVYLPVTVQPPATKNVTPPGVPANASQLNATPGNATGNPAGNATVNQTATGNQTGTAGAMPAIPSCPLPLALFAALGVCWVRVLK